MPYIDMSELTTNHTEHSPYYTYFLDKRAYIIANGGSVGETKTMVLPEPSSAWNGFVYYILVLGKRLGTYTDTEGVSCFVTSSSGSTSSAETILDYVYQPYGNKPFCEVGMYGGKYQFVCANVDGNYKWVMTEATGGANMKSITLIDQNDTGWRCFRPVFGYESTNAKPQIKNIKSVSSVPSTTDTNTMYVINN